MSIKNNLKAAMAILMVAAACGKGPLPGEGTAYLVTDYESSDVPETIPYNGGEYTLRLKTEIVTRSTAPTFVEWQYRVTEGGIVGEPVAVTTPVDEITVVISPNYSESERDIVVEMSDADAEGEWTRIVEAKQEAALVKVGDFWWAKANVTVKDGQFALADRMSDPGYFFRNGSIYGVPSDGTYEGTAYKPEAEAIALADIPYGDSEMDPCSMVDPGFRTPTYLELSRLFEMEDYGNEHELDGIKGMGYMNSSFFMPFSGSMEIATGTVSGQSQLAGYWGLGENYYGEGVIYVLNAEYSLVDFDLSGTNMASLRCVKNVRQPSYLSHSPEEVETNAEFALTVSTDPGEFPVYEVAIEAEDGEYVAADAGPDSKDVTLMVPQNDNTEAREWKIFVNSRYTGASFVQPGMKDYVIYRSHTPREAGHEAFDLVVRYESDLAEFPVAVKDESGQEVAAGTCVGSSGEVTLRVPENTGKERTLGIWLNGTDTGASVVQEGAPSSSLLSVIWSEGFLTVVDGEYTFAAPEEVGMYFKWKSRYGIDLGKNPTSSSKFEGTAYGPEAKTFSDYAEIPNGEVDPCSFVAPAGTWRMPSPELFEEFGADGMQWGGTDAYKTVSDGEQSLVFALSGQLRNDGSKVMLPTGASLVWTDALSDEEGKAQYYMWSKSSDFGKLSQNSMDTGMMIRCVRDK